MRIVDQGYVFDARQEPPARRFCSFSNALVLSDGRILVTFRAGHSKDDPQENVLIRQSSDGGTHWETLFEGLDPVIDGLSGGWRSGALTELAPGHLIGAFDWFDRSDPSRPLANPQTQGTLRSRIFVMESFDGGRTWERRREVDTAPYAGIAQTGPIRILPDGTLALQYEAWKDYDDPRPGEHHAIVRLSRDGAHSFGPSIIVAHDQAAALFYWDQRLAVNPATNQLFGLFWTHNRPAGQDISIHAAVSAPDGAEWSVPWDAGFAGQIASPLFLSDGQLFAAYVHRHNPPTLRAILSADGGHTWDKANELVFYESGAGRESGMGGQRDFGDYWADMSVWSFGHAEPALLPNGDVFVAFYAGDASAMSMRWVRIAL